MTLSLVFNTKKQTVIKQGCLCQVNHLSIRNKIRVTGTVYLNKIMIIQDLEAYRIHRYSCKKDIKMRSTNGVDLNHDYLNN